MGLEQHQPGCACLVGEIWGRPTRRLTSPRPGFEQEQQQREPSLFSGGQARREGYI